MPTKQQIERALELFAGEGLGALEMAARGMTYDATGATLHHGGECEACETMLRQHRQRSS